MDYRSLAISFRIQLGFHAGNNEGSGGTNVMEPRRISVGDKEYDGISGEIIRHHILENFVKLCRENNVNLHSRCQGLVPDRGKDPLKTWMEANKANLPIKEVRGKKLPQLSPPHYPSATEDLLKNCALCDVGGYLLALEESDNAQGTLKRDSCFEMGWLITEHPAIVDFTQQSAYDPDPDKNNLFVQNMRTGIYGGVLRIDIDRVGFNDWWWLANNIEKYPVQEDERKKRIRLLVKAIHQWILSPSFAKQAGWLPHMNGLLEGAVVLSKDGPAPFFSPIKFEYSTDSPAIKPNPDYIKMLNDVKSKDFNNIDVKEFKKPDEFKEKMSEVEINFNSQEKENGKEKNKSTS